jgi:uncharacterized protein YukE
MPVLHMQTDAVRQTGQQLYQTAQSLDGQTQRLTQAVQHLSGQWQGLSADLFVGDAQPLLRTLLQLAQTGEELNQRLQREVDEWERVDNRLVGAGSNGAVLGTALATNEAIEQIKLKNKLINSYTEGNVYLLSTEKYDPFNFPDYLKQYGPNCTLFGIFRQLHMLGMKTPSDVEISALVDEFRDKYGLEPQEGFPLKAAIEFLESKGYQYETEDFTPGYTVFGKEHNLYGDPSSAQSYLIQTLQKGQPVYVDYNFEAGRHAMNVIGVNVDDSGNLISVLVDTNYGTYETIEGQSFIDNWISAGGEAITIELSNEGYKGGGWSGSGGFEGGSTGQGGGGGGGGVQ